MPAQQSMTCFVHQASIVALMMLSTIRMRSCQPLTPPLGVDQYPDMLARQGLFQTTKALANYRGPALRRQPMLAKQLVSFIQDRVHRRQF